MRVSDNGSGMHPDEALLALERHATSKIREAGDLDHILSFASEAKRSLNRIGLKIHPSHPCARQ